MSIKKAATVVFSPCGSTEKVTQFLTSGLPVEVENHNLTLPDARKSKLSFDNETLVFFSFPVYDGLPKNAPNIFACVKGNDTPCVYVAVRGDTETKSFFPAIDKLAAPLDFKPVAAIAAVAEHTLMPTVSHGRPDKEDAELLRKFGIEACQRANEGKILSEMPGDKDHKPDLAFYPVTDADACIHCGLCVENCPVAAISEDDTTTQDNSICIMCSECAHVCPVDARTMGGAKGQEMLHKAATETFANLHLETKIFV